MIDRVKVSSQSTDATYVVTFVGETAVACTCPHYNFRSADESSFVCKHMRSAQAVTPITLSRADTIRFRSYLALEG